MSGMTSYYKSTDELKDTKGRRTTLVVRMTLEECNALLDAASAGAEELHKVPAPLDWVLTRIAAERTALIDERIAGE